MDILSAIKKNKVAVVAGRDYFSQLNSVRIAVKHQGIFPNPQQWYRVGEITYEYVSEWCQDYLGLSLDELDESALIKDREVKEWYDKAKNAFRQGQYKECLEHLAYATKSLFRSNRALRNLSVGNPNAEDAIKLAAFGVHANDYLALQEFLPSFRFRAADKIYVVKWDQKKYGHPGNWTKTSAEFSLKTFVNMALRIQDAEWIPGAIGFDLLYEHEITALVDDVEITQEKPGSTLASICSPERVVVRILKRNESLRCRVSPKERSWHGGLLSHLEPQIFSIFIDDPLFWGEVQADKVHVTCVPKDNELVRDYFPDLPEIEYKP
jgi:hypothetical protein